jgi:DNA polymerase-3 subunit gamma/tau
VEAMLNNFVVLLQFITMGQFIVSARKYRPLRFDQVVGQDHITRTLKNALQQDTLAHAFLFCGPRGVGKTTCARILAKVLNCENPTQDMEPCGKCSSCETFDRNASLNILELDGASHNGVENIRTLIEQVRFQPQAGKFKVFIIDEVHMLSLQAFNAFLKTLEEPPHYAIFILATTEKHKIIPTILSRCQIFDFKRIQTNEITHQLKKICDEEGIQADPEALHILADKSDGALRDALSLFDKMVSFSEKNISYQDVISSLNVLDFDYYFKIVDALLLEDISNILHLFEEINHKGFEGAVFINGLGEHLRNLLLCKDPETQSLFQVSEGLMNRYLDQSKNTPFDFLISSLDIANECDVQYRMAQNKRLHIEIALIKMNYAHRVIQSRDLDTVSSADQEKGKKKSDRLTESEIESDLEDNSNQQSGTVIQTIETTEQPVEVSLSDDMDLKEPEEIKPSKVKKKQPLRDSVTDKNTGDLAGPSLADLSELVKEVETQNHGKSPDPQNIKLDDLEDVWSSYAREQASNSVRTVLERTRLEVKNNCVVAWVGSSVSKSVILQETKLIETLRSALKMPRLTIQIKIDPSSEKEEPVKLWTVKEKYEHIQNINPHFKEFMTKFNLKIDHD